MIIFVAFPVPSVPVIYIQVLKWKESTKDMDKQKKKLLITVNQQDFKQYTLQIQTPAISDLEQKMKV